MNAEVSKMSAEMAQRESQHFFSCLEDHKHRLTDRLTTAIREVEQKEVEVMKLTEQVNQLKKELADALMPANAVTDKQHNLRTRQHKKISDQIRESNQRLTIENIKLLIAKYISDQQNKNNTSELKKLTRNLTKANELLEQRTVVNNKQTDVINRLKIELSKKSTNTIEMAEKRNEDLIKKLAITQQMLEDQTKANARMEQSFNKSLKSLHSRSRGSISRLLPTIM